MAIYSWTFGLELNFQQRNHVRSCIHFKYADAGVGKGLFCVDG